MGGGTSSYEAMLEQKRAALRRALKTEYIRKVYNPKSYTPEGYVEVHDAALTRWHAMQKTVPEYWFPNIRSALFAFCLVGVPLCTHMALTHWDKKDFERKCRNGEYAYDDPKRQMKAYLY